ncbi:fimbrial protein [Proteus sp. ZN5]|uniref:fimbrial protein n=1 Tax=Proteus sp. ZN5 TaxID=2697019 RepID=UPI0013E0FD56|nr:fimbrial protein [Proteus sp. ZN5]QIG04896.1 fimbrial protein [Proteus sp. ZN5]
MKPIIKNSLALMLLLFPVAEVMAKPDVHCFTIKPTIQLHISVGGSVFLGPDAPIGTILYQGYVDTATYKYNYQCNGDFTNPDEVYRIAETETSRMLSISGTHIKGGGIPDAVYQTNLPGVGVRFFVKKEYDRPIMAGQEVDLFGTFTREISLKILNGAHGISYYGKPHLSYSLIKTGPIQPGNAHFTAHNQVIINFPNDRLDHVVAPEFPYTFFDTYITGSVNVFSSSCKTQDYTVELGKHKTSEMPTKGSSTNWVNSDIILTNCPAFRGYYSGKKGNVVSTEVGHTFPDRDPNELRVTIKPVNPAIPEYPGTFKVNDVPGAAKGVGIQLAFGDVGEDFVKFNTPTAFAQPVTEKAGTVSIPLRARYIRTDDRISAGRADGAATFMIEYY